MAGITDEAFVPELTFEPAEAALVEREYARAARIVEYGSGGSTILAARLGGKELVSVESDRDWFLRMKAILERDHPREAVRLMHVDVGPTGEWGTPVGHSKLKYWRYLRYSHAVWWRNELRDPDLVLVDGRFRVACFLASMAHIRKPTRLLFDDYTRHGGYRYVERYCRPAEIVGRMAAFDLKPRPFMRLELLKDARQLVNYA